MLGRVWRIAVPIAIAMTLLAPVPPVVASEQEYLAALYVQLEVAGRHLDEASDAIGDCSEDFYFCLGNPEDFAPRIDMAREGLMGVRANLSAMTVPDSYAEIHDQLSLGLDQVIGGISLYAAGLREFDPEKLTEGISQVDDGEENISTAVRTLADRTRPGLDLSWLLILAGAATAGAVGMLVFTVVREVREDRREGIEEWAKCPKCGEVLDQWWTFRFSQVRAWRSDHLRGHKQERGGGGSSEDGTS